MKKFLSLVLALVMTMSLVTVSAGAKDFTDADKVTYAEAVDVLSAVKVIDGYPDGAFKPTNQLNRGQAAKIICNLILGPTTAGALKADAAPYKDVPADSTFAGYIAYCAKEGIIDGYTDGTFRPSAPLTGYAFMKFLLGALGYDSTIEGYVGNNWSIAVAKRALNIKLAKGLTDDFNGAKPVTREEACLYAFNALNAKAVKYETKGSNIVVGGVTIATGASEVKVDTDYANYAKKVFGNDLKGVPQDDAYGRPGTKWTYKKTEIGTYAEEADASYVGDVKLYTLRSDLELGNSDTPAFYYVANTVDPVVKTATSTGDAVQVKYYNSSTTTKLSALDTLGYYVGNGVKVEVFYDKDDSNYNRIVVIDEYYDEIKDVDTDDDGRYVEFKTTSGKFYTEDFAKKDKVLVTRGSDSDPAVTVTAVEKQTGTISKVVGTGTSAKYTIDGTEYKLHHLYTSTAGAGDTVDFYLDSDGNIIKMSITAGSSNVENLVLFTDSKDSGYDKIAKAIYGTGKTETVTLKDANTTPMNVYNFSISSGKVRVTSNSDYTSTYYGKAGTDYYDFSNGVNVIKSDGGETITKIDNNTQFVYVDANGDTKTYTGYKTAPSFSNAKKVVTFRKDADAAALVYVWTNGATVSYNDKSLTMAIVDTYDVIKTKDENGNNIVDHYEVRTLSGDTVKVDQATYDAMAAYKNAGVVVYTAMGKDSNGIVDTTTKKTTNLYYETSLASGAVIKEDAGVLYLSTRDLAYDDDIVVYEIASNGDTFEKIELSDIDDRADKYAGYTAITDTTGDVVTTLVLKKA